MHVVFDQVSLARQKKIQRREKQRQQEAKNLNQLLQNSVYLDSMGTDPTKTANQLGKVMLSKDLEMAIAKLCPSLTFIDNPWRHDKRAVGYQDSTGWHTVSVYEKGYMPERSVLKSQEELVPDLDNYEMKNKPIERKDMPKGEFDPVKGWVYPEGTVLPGWKKVRHPYGEAVRGWRTVLLQLIHRGHTSPAAVEAILGSDNTPQWAAHTGKHSLQVRW